MASTSSEASASNLSMKLLIDTKNGRVLYAEAGKDVIDFLFSLLALPVGTIVKILSKDSMVGSVGNLYGSIEKLDETYVLSADAKDALLAPAGCYDGGKLLQLPEPEDEDDKEDEDNDNEEEEEPAATKFYRCRNFFKYTECQGFLSKVHGARCQRRNCSGKMTVAMRLMDSSSGSGGPAAVALASALAGAGFVQGIVTYTVMDDLKVAPMSAISGITLFNTFGVTDIGMLQEKTVQLGYAERLDILRVSLQSKTVLTDVFLGKKQKA